MVHAGTTRGLVWTPETLDAFLLNPQGLVPGTAMWIPSLTAAGDRQDLIDYLAQTGPCPAAPPPPAPKP
jgi:cytochrome c